MPSGGQIFLLGLPTSLMLASGIVLQSLKTTKINSCILVVVGDVDKPSTTIFSREIQSSHVTLAMDGMILF